MILPNELSENNAKTVLEKMKELEIIPKYMEPTVEEGISISFKNEDKYADIECFNSGEILGIISDKNGEFVWNVKDLGLIQSILKIKEFII